MVKNYVMIYKYTQPKFLDLNMIAKDDKVQFD